MMWPTILYRNLHPWRRREIADCTLPQLHQLYKEMIGSLEEEGYIFHPLTDSFYPPMFRYEDTMQRMKEHVFSLGVNWRQFTSGSYDNTTIIPSAAPNIVIQQQQQPQPVIVQAPAPQQVIYQQAQTPAPQVIQLPARQPQIIYETVDQFGRVVSRSSEPQSPVPNAGWPALLATENGPSSGSGSAESDYDKRYQEWKELQRM